MDDPLDMRYSGDKQASLVSAAELLSRLTMTQNGAPERNSQPFSETTER